MNTGSRKCNWGIIAVSVSFIIMICAKVAIEQALFEGIVLLPIIAFCIVLTFIGWKSEKRLRSKKSLLEYSVYRAKDRLGIVNDALDLYGEEAEIPGLFMAQFKLGLCYLEGEGIEKNNVQAYKWIAISEGGQSHKYACEIILKKLKKQMTATQLAEAELLIDTFDAMRNNYSRNNTGFNRTRTFPETLSRHELVVDGLLKLEKLKESGHISEDDFNERCRYIQEDDLNKAKKKIAEYNQ